MTEPNPPYLGEREKRCICGVKIGDLVDVNGRIWLRIGNVELRNGHGRCRRCKQVWHYDDLDYVLAALVNMDVE